MNSVEITAKTVEEATELALKQLSARRDEVKIEVISRGKVGILGIGAEPARVRLSRLISAGVIDEPVTEARIEPAPRPGTAIDSQIPQQARAVLLELLKLMGVEAKVTPTGAEPDENDPARLNVSFNIEGEDSALLIGRNGETLGALQFLANFIFNHKEKDEHATILLDVEGYKERRYNNIRSMAKRMAERVMTSGAGISMMPMPPAERRVVHMELAGHTYVYTQSTGEGIERKVQILPKPGVTMPPQSSEIRRPYSPARPGARRPVPRPGYSKGVRYTPGGPGPNRYPASPT
jgi:spoIIIJ-associated protein